jgi:AP-3 complex subunit delta
VVIAADETLTGSGASTPRYDSENSDRATRPTSTKSKSSLLQVSSLGLGSLNLDGASLSPGGPSTADDEEMARAMKEVEQLRLEMQRASERVHVPQGVHGVVTVKKKKKAAAAAAAGVSGGDGAADVVVKKKKKKVKAVEGEEAKAGAGEVGDGSVRGVTAVPKKKKKKRVVEIE